MRSDELLFSLSLAALLLSGCVAKQPTSVATRSTAAPTTTTPLKLAPAAEAEVLAVEFSPDAKWMAVGTLQREPTLQGVVCVRDVATNRIIKSWQLQGGVKYLAFSPDGNTLAVAGSQSRLTVWRWRTGQLLHSEKQNTDFAGENRVDVDFSPDGRWLATAAGGKFINTQTWKPRSSPRPFGSNQIIEYVRFAPHGRFLLMGLANDDMLDNFRYCFVNVKTGQYRKIHHFSWAPPAFSRDGSLLAANEFDSVPVIWHWNGRNLKTRQTLRTKQFQPQAFSPDGRFIAGLRVDSQSEGPIEVWSVATGKCLHRFKQTAQRVVWLKPNTLLIGGEKGAQRLSFKL